jgi:hypothetical protein
LARRSRAATAATPTNYGKTSPRTRFNHEYQHDQWISEVRAENLGHTLPPDPESDRLSRVDGYLVLNPYD